MTPHVLRCCDKPPKGGLFATAKIMAWSQDRDKVFAHLSFQRNNGSGRSALSDGVPDVDTQATTG
jgi:hypothetical protein